MMKDEAIRKESTAYLERLEVWYLLRWKKRLELLNETTNDLWLLRKVLKDRKMNVVKFPRDENHA